jgi:hypothetical protein
MNRREQSSTHRLDRLSSHSDRGRKANYTCVRVRQVMPCRTALEGATKGGMPEVLHTSYGSLTVGLDATPGQILRQAERRVGPGPVEAECCNFDQHLFRSRCQDRQVRDLKSVWRSRRVQYHRLNGGHQRRSAIWTGTGVSRCSRNRRRVLDICDLHSVPQLSRQTDQVTKQPDQLDVRGRTLPPK